MGERLKNSLRLFFFVLLMGIVGPIHFQSYPEAASFLMLSYIVNFILALFSLLLLYWGLTKKKENLSSFYLITVAVKLGVYFLFFHPQFYLDGQLTRSEFFIFFIPYALGLLAEIVILFRFKF
jgi:hypothetical protein